MDKHLEMRLTEAPYKTFQPLRKLPVYCKRNIPTALNSHMLHDQVQIVCQELPGWKSYSSFYTLLAVATVPIHLRVAQPATFFFQPMTPGMTFKQPVFKPVSLAINQVTALHLPVGSYHSLLKPGVHELCIMEVPYGLLVHHSEMHAYLKRICKHWKEHPHHLKDFRLGHLQKLLIEYPDDFEKRPEQLFEHFQAHYL